MSTQCYISTTLTFFSEETEEHEESIDENHRETRQAPGVSGGVRVKPAGESRESGDRFERLVNSVCKDPQAKAKAKQCLSQLKTKESGSRPDFKAIQQQICQKKTDCLKK